MFSCLFMSIIWIRVLITSSHTKRCIEVMCFALLMLGFSSFQALVQLWWEYSNINNLGTNFGFTRVVKHPFNIQITVWYWDIFSLRDRKWATMFLFRVFHWNYSPLKNQTKPGWNLQSSWFSAKSESAVIGNLRLFFLHSSNLISNIDVRFKYPKTFLTQFVRKTVYELQNLDKIPGLADMFRIALLDRNIKTPIIAWYSDASIEWTFWWCSSLSEKLDVIRVSNVFKFWYTDFSRLWAM